MTTITQPGARPVRLPMSRTTRIALAVSGVIAVFSIVRTIADANDLTSSSTFAAALGATAPIFLAGLGGLFSERAGVVNIGLEGMMVLGTFGAGYFGYLWGPYAALIGGVLFGALGGLLHAVATVTFGVDHVVSGFAINILAPGVARFLASELFVGRRDGTITQSPSIEGSVARLDMPFLAGGRLGGWTTPDPLLWLERRHWIFISDIAALLRGFMHDLAFPTLVAMILLPVSIYVLWHTPFGLRLRSVGEKPTAADTLAVPVYRMKYYGVVISGGLAGLGGAWLVTNTRSYLENQPANRGFQGLAALVFGNYKPTGVAGGAGLFAYAQALTQRTGTQPVRALFLIAAIALGALAVRSLWKRRVISGVTLAVVAPLALAYYIANETVNNQIVFITPFVVTLLVLAFASQRLRMPAADGKPWRKGMTE